MQTVEFLIDHGNPEIDQVFSTIFEKTRAHPIIISYAGTYLDTLRQIIILLPNDDDLFVWICSSISDYSQFDFTPPITEDTTTHLHVYPTTNQLQGDTFFFKADVLKNVIGDTKDLQYLGTVDYDKPIIPRLPAPVIITEGDTHTHHVHTDFKFPYAIFQTEPIDRIWYPSLWDTKKIMINSTGATSIVVPKEAQQVIKNELYDYPHILSGSFLAESKPLDIVFLSNGEPDAEKNWEHLLDTTSGYVNRVTRIDGVIGRVQAYKAAAKASYTPWFFTVFAKLWVDSEFDWSWQPDRMQIPKHYIFTASNPVNGLIYGHQAMIAYNKKLVLANEGRGLDFTLDDPHSVVDIISGEARFNTDPWNTWKTSFREVIKLRHDRSLISKSRLESWCNIAVGPHAEWSRAGASDALEYYQEASGDIEQLRYSYEWKWLREYFDEKYT